MGLAGTSPFPRLEYLELDLLDRPLGLTADVIRYLATDSLRRITVRHVIYHRYNFDEGRVLDLVATKFRQIKLDSLLSEGVLRRLERLLWNCSHVGVRQFVALGDHIRAMVPNATRRGVFVVEGQNYQSNESPRKLMLFFTMQNLSMAGLVRYYSASRPQSRSTTVIAHSPVPGISSAALDCSVPEVPASIFSCKFDAPRIDLKLSYVPLAPLSRGMM